MWCPTDRPRLVKKTQCSPGSCDRDIRGRDHCLGADPDHRDERLRHVDVDAQLAGIGHHEHRRGRAAAGIDKGSQVRFARGDHAVEGRQHILVAGQRLEPVNIGLVRLDGRLFTGEVGNSLVQVLLGNSARVGKALPPFQGRLRQSGVGLGIEKVGARLHELLVEVRCVDLGQELSGLDACPDVDLPVLQVATHARIDGRARVALPVGPAD